MTTVERLVKAGWPSQAIKAMAETEKQMMAASDIVGEIPNDVLETVVGKMVSSFKPQHPTQFRRKYNEASAEVKRGINGLLANNYNGPINDIRVMFLHGKFVIPKAEEMSELVEDLILMVSRQIWGKPAYTDAVRRFLYGMSVKGKGGVLIRKSDLLPFVQAACYMVQAEIHGARSKALLDTGRTMLDNSDYYPDSSSRVSVEFPSGKAVLVPKEASAEDIMASVLEDELGL